MQINEITKPSLGEGFLGDLKKLGQAVTSKNFSRGFARGLAHGITGTNVLAPTQGQLDKATRGRARQLAQKWEKQIQTQQQTKPVATTPIKSAGTKPATAPGQSSLPSITIGGKLLTKGPDGLWHGETGAAVNDPAQAAKIDKAYQDQEYRKKQFQQTAMVKEAPQEYTTPGGIVAPGNTKTDPKSSNTVDFETWADQQLTTQVSGTQQHIDLDAVKKDPGVKAELDKIIPQIKKDPTNISAVEMYFYIAMKGMQRMATQARKNAGIDSAPSNTNSLNDIINDQQLTAIKNLLQDPQTSDETKQILGIE